jgi:hypothetical protein
MSVVGVCSSLHGAQKLAISRMKEREVDVRKQVGDNWSKLVDTSCFGDLTSPCGTWLVSIEQHTVDAEIDNDDTSES